MNELENGLSRDLLDDLLEGLPNDVAVDRASAQGHDLGVPHDLIVSAWSSDRGQRGHDRDVDHLRRALARQRLPCLVGRNQGLVVALTYRGVDIGRLFDDLSRGYGDTNGVIAKGEPFNSPQQIPRAYEQAQRALRLASSPPSRMAPSPTPTWEWTGSLPLTPMPTRSNASSVTGSATC